MRCSEPVHDRASGRLKRGRPGPGSTRARRVAAVVLAIVAVASVAAPATAQGAAWTAVPDAFVPGHDGSRIVPTPQEIVTGDGAFVLAPGASVILHADTPALRAAVGMLQEDAARRHGARPRVTVDPRVAAGAGPPSIRVGILGREGAPRTTAAAVDRAEGYLLEVRPDGVTVLGADERGAFYGVHSLRQLLGGGPAIPAVTVRDWPALPWRVAMVYLDAASDGVNERLLPILAELKFNAVLVMSNYVEWDVAPELHLPLSAPRAAAERLAVTARSNLLEPIPLLETLSHSEWFFANGANAELRADPTAARAFVMDPTHPDLYERLLPIVDELIDIFSPRWFHVGHDEVRNVHPFPATPAQEAVGYGRLFVGSVTRLHRHIASRGVETVLWDDELVAAEVRELWSELPPGLIVASWRYLPAGAFPRLELVADAGFTTLGASWFDPDNVTSMARHVHRLGADGLIQTRWTGYFGNASMMRGQYRQVYAYVTAAGAAWNPTAEAVAGAPGWFRSAWLRAHQGGRRSGATVDLEAAGGSSIRTGLFDLEDGYALTELLAAESRFGGIRYRLGSALTVQGSHPRARARPERVTVPIDRTARTVAFLHATGWYGAPGDVVGRYEIVHADGTTSEAPLVYGQNIAAWTETDVATIDLEQPWQGRTANGLEVAAYQLRWRNPRPDLPIERIELVGAGGIAAPVLFGITLLD